MASRNDSEFSATERNACLVASEILLLSAYSVDMSEPYFRGVLDSAKLLRRIAGPAAAITNNGAAK